MTPSLLFSQRRRRNVRETISLETNAMIKRKEHHMEIRNVNTVVKDEEYTDLLVGVTSNKVPHSSLQILSAHILQILVPQLVKH